MSPRPLRALSLALAVNGALLLGCLNGSLIKTNTNKPAASGTPAAAASATPSGFQQTLAHWRSTGDRLGNAGSRAIDAISIEDERAIGQAAALNIIQQSGGLVLEQGLVQYVNAVANHVGLYGKRAETGKDGIARIKARRFFVGVLDDDSMNAYALPGGYILITRGLLQNLSCESDLAWVLAHEITHIDNEDGLKALKVSVGSTAFAKELLRPGEETASFDNPKFFNWIVDKLTGIMLDLGMGREDERQADNKGLMLSTLAGYDSRGAERVLELLGTHPAKRRLFKSHDDPATRLQLLRTQIDGIASGKLGIERYDRGAIERLEAARLSRAPNGGAP